MTAADTPSQEELLAQTLCKSGRFETGEGTCALICLDQLGDVRKKGCSHVASVHGKLAKALDEAARLTAKPADDDVRELLDRALPIFEAAADGKSVQIAAGQIAREIRAISTKAKP